MSALVMKFFTAEQINRQRVAENAVNAGRHQPWNPETRPKEMLEVKLNSYLDVSGEDVMRYQDECEKAFAGRAVELTRPYFSLVSDNATNELRVGPRGCSEEYLVMCDDLDCFSEHVVEDSELKKYTFYNR